jgi:cyclopropane-fatty-acyl-phospholipid synthase
MSMLALEHGKVAYWADFVFYGLVELSIVAFLWHTTQTRQWPFLTALALAGLGTWTLVEYAMHRFVLHGMLPFSRWHGEHHLRPSALISAPTLLSASLITALVFVPTLILTGPQFAGALTFGFLLGYLGFSATHHAMHHWRADSGWLRRRKIWHGVHHLAQRPACYGVTTAFWDRVFRSAGRTQIGDPAPEVLGLLRIWR